MQTPFIPKPVFLYHCVFRVMFMQIFNLLSLFGNSLKTEVTSYAFVSSRNLALSTQTRVITTVKSTLTRTQDVQEL